MNIAFLQVGSEFVTCYRRIWSDSDEETEPRRVARGARLREYEYIGDGAKSVFESRPIPPACIDDGIELL